MRFYTIVLFLLAFAMGIVAAAQAQGPDHAAMPGPDHAAMAERHAEMMAHMEAENARMDALVAEMNGASGDARSDAMAALLTELVAQRKMCAHMMQMMHGGGHGEHAEHAGQGEHADRAKPAEPADRR